MLHGKKLSAVVAAPAVVVAGAVAATAGSPVESGSAHRRCSDILQRVKPRNRIHRNLHRANIV